MKKCSKCGVEKDLAEFSKGKNYKDGLQHRCKNCTKEYYKANVEEILENKKEYYKTNIEEIKEYQKEYYKANVEEILENKKEYQKYNAEQIKEYQKEYYKANVENLKEYKKEYNKVNAEQILENKKKYQKQRRQNDPLFKLKCGIRSLIGIVIKNGGYKKTSKTASILGCTFEEFKLHIEKQFSQGMSWDNRELWHLDHIYPVSLAVDEHHLLQLNHYTNFQPLWAEDNLKKGNKLI
ncbi:MAG: hypothetical protein PHG08_00360 [Bacilli bacterium]|nr:hypothetical protein [Bacilli bacterium]